MQLKNVCYRVHGVFVLLPVLLLPPIISLLQLVATILSALNSTKLDVYDPKYSSIGGTFSKCEHKWH